MAEENKKPDENLSSDFVIKNVEDYKEIENVKTKVWVIKLVLSAFLLFAFFMVIGVSWYMYNNPTDATIGGSTLEQIFSVIKIIIDGVF